MKYLYKYITITIALIACSCSLYAQSSSSSALMFNRCTHDFGHIDEDGGVVSCLFEATNTSSSTIDIISITTTCGCTTAKYDNTSISPGGHFTFEASFNPINRPGRLDKLIFVKTSDATEEIRLNIIGYVNPRERTIDELYPFDMGGGLRLKSNFHAFGYLEHGKELTEYIGYTNTSKRAIEVQVIHEQRSGMLQLSLPEHIEANASGDISLRYAIGNESQYYGTCRDVIRLIVDGSEATYTLTTQAIVVDNFDYMDDISAPKLVISKNFIKFGDVNSPSEAKEQRVTLTNEGGSPLLIRALESSTPAIECQMERNIVIDVGGSHEIVVRLNAAHIEDWDNPFTARLYVITNDPMRPMQNIKVNALPR